MDGIENSTSNEEGSATAGATQIQIQVSGSGGETQMVTLPLSMASAISSAQGQSVITANQQSVIQPPILQDSAKRRELLSRRPSYRKILNELSGQPDENQRIKDEPGGGSKSSESSESDSGSQVITSMQAPTIAYQTGTGTVTVHQPPQTIQIAASGLNHADQNSATSVTGLQTFSMANALAQGHTIVQGDGGGSGNMWLPGNHVVVQGDTQMYQIRTPTSTTSLPSVVMSGTTMQSPQQMAEEASRKRELRLMKNREAAKECRRRKKEYVKCLETRVAVLENQNKQLIDELKTLKELYVHKQVD
uniref:CREB/ATF-c n=1 Tax=Phallusia mammillata TaxID=59560 RepID=A0A6F9DAU2_9ASCI|nr:CREB/ATF-c [Phallusia mammillata]